jgi:hypothetical protein
MYDKVFLVSYPSLSGLGFHEAKRLQPMDRYLGQRPEQGKNERGKGKKECGMSVQVRLACRSVDGEEAEKV